jgi:aspartyl-tRNA(Asn)/glutamyl-tRNA(Gln) amidotransferase subunit A
VSDYSASLERGVVGVRIGVIRELNGGLSDEVSGSYHAALETLRAQGATVEEVSMPSTPLSSAMNGLITWAEALEFHEQWIRTRRDEYGEDVRRLLELGMMVPATAYIRAQRARIRTTAEALAALENHDVLVAPGSAIVAPKIGSTDILGGEAREDRLDVVSDILRFTQPFDVTGQPALAIPTGLSSDGLPVGMQIIGRPFDEAMVLQVASAYEKARAPIPAPPEVA